MSSLSQFITLKVIGKGAFGVCRLVETEEHRLKVFEGFRESLLKPDADSTCKGNLRLVLKSIDLKRLKESQRRSVLNEANLLRSLDHPNIIRYKGSFLEKQSLHILMDYADGGDLHSFLHRLSKSSSPPLSSTRLHFWSIQLFEALKYIHNQRVLHRDLKAKNILLRRSGRTAPLDFDLKVADFGVSKLLEHAEDIALTPLGTPYYIAPEIWLQRPYGKGGDMWAAGCVLYEMCTFQHAFQGRSVEEVKERVLKRRFRPLQGETHGVIFVALVSKLLSLRPSSRPSAAECLESPLFNDFLGRKPMVRGKEEGRQEGGFQPLVKNVESISKYSDRTEGRKNESSEKKKGGVERNQQGGSVLIGALHLPRKFGSSPPRYPSRPTIFNPVCFPRPSQIDTSRRRDVEPGGKSRKCASGLKARRGSISSIASNCGNKGGSSKSQPAPSFHCYPPSPPRSVKSVSSSYRRPLSVSPTSTPCVPPSSSPYLHPGPKPSLRFSSPPPYPGSSFHVKKDSFEVGHQRYEERVEQTNQKELVSPNLPSPSTLSVHLEPGGEAENWRKVKKELNMENGRGKLLKEIWRLDEGEEGQSKKRSQEVEVRKNENKKNPARLERGRPEQERRPRKGSLSPSLPAPVPRLVGTIQRLGDPKKEERTKSTPVKSPRLSEVLSNEPRRGSLQEHRNWFYTRKQGLREDQEVEAQMKPDNFQKCEKERNAFQVESLRCMLEKVGYRFFIARHQ